MIRLPFFVKLQEDLKKVLIGEAQLSAPREDGTTLREHLQTLFERSGIKDERLNVPTLCGLGKLLYQTYKDLSNNSRQYSQFGQLPFTYHDLLTWERFNGVELEPWEATILLTVDKYVISELTKGQ